MSLQNFFVKVICKILAIQCFFIDHLKHKTVIKKTSSGFLDLLSLLQPGVFFLYLLKTSENLKVFCFQGV